MSHKCLQKQQSNETVIADFLIIFLILTIIPKIKMEGEITLHNDKMPFHLNGIYTRQFHDQSRAIDSDEGIGRIEGIHVHVN